MNNALNSLSVPLLYGGLYYLIESYEGQDLYVHWLRNSAILIVSLIGSMMFATFHFRNEEKPKEDRPKIDAILKTVGFLLVIFSVASLIFITVNSIVLNNSRFILWFQIVFMVLTNYVIVRTILYYYLAFMQE